MLAVRGERAFPRRMPSPPEKLKFIELGEAGSTDEVPAPVITGGGEVMSIHDVSRISAGEQSCVNGLLNG